MNPVASCSVHLTKSSTTVNIHCCNSVFYCELITAWRNCILKIIQFLGITSALQGKNVITTNGNVFRGYCAMEKDKKDTNWMNTDTYYVSSHWTLRRYWNRYRMPEKSSVHTWNRFRCGTKPVPLLFLRPHERSRSFSLMRATDSRIVLKV